MNELRPVVAYYRLDRRTARPARRGPTEAERRVARWLRSQRRTLLEPFVEGPGPDRPELRRALARCQATRATLLVPSLLALGSDLAWLEAVLATRVPVACADRPGLRRSELWLLRDVARHARRAAGERVREGLAGALRRGARLGSPRPEIGARRAGARLREDADSRAAQVAPWIEEIRLGNPDCSLREIGQGLAAAGIPTPRGGRWGPSAVRNALARARSSSSPDRIAF
jgi:hypothetical protein